MRIDEDADAEQLRKAILALVGRYHEIAHKKPPFVSGVSSAPVSGRVYDASDMQTLVDSALDFWLTTGRFNDAFEERLAKRIGVKHALTVNSGSSANLVALSALTSPNLKARHLRPGDEVITCATGFPTTVNPALMWNLVPVFVDVDIPTYNIDVSALEAAITAKTRAVMVAHTLGNPFDVVAVKALCDRHSLFLVEDCCDALGATVEGRHVGAFGDVGTLSFYPAHHITMGEGGAVFTNNNMLDKVMASFRDWGRDCYCAPGLDNTCNKRFAWKLGDLPKGFDHKYIYSHLGFNLKITDMQAAVGVAQLDHLDDFIAARRRNYRALKAGLKPLEFFSFCLRRPPEQTRLGSAFRSRCARSAFHPRRTRAPRNARKIGTRLLFGGNLVRQPYMKGRNFRIAGSLTNADVVVDRAFWIGVYPGLGRAEIEYVLETFEAFCRTTWRSSLKGHRP